MRAPGIEMRPGMDMRAPGMDMRAPGLDMRAPGMEMRPPGMDMRAPGLEMRAPGIERKNSSNLFNVDYPGFSVDYEQKKLLANKGMFNMMKVFKYLKQKTKIQIRKFYKHQIVIIFLPIKLNLCFGC